MKFHCFFYVAAFLDCFLFSCFSRALATQRHNYTEAHVLTHGWRPNGQLNYPMTLYLLKFISSRCLYPINKIFYELLCDHHATTKLCNGNFPLWLPLERYPGTPFFDQKNGSPGHLLNRQKNPSGYWNQAENCHFAMFVIWFHSMSRHPGKRLKSKLCALMVDCVHHDSFNIVSFLEGQLNKPPS